MSLNLLSLINWPATFFFSFYNLRKESETAQNVIYLTFFNRGIIRRETNNFIVPRLKIIEVFLPYSCLLLLELLSFFKIAKINLCKKRVRNENNVPDNFAIILTVSVLWWVISVLEVFRLFFGGTSRVRVSLVSRFRPHLRALGRRDQR